MKQSGATAQKPPAKAEKRCICPSRAVFREPESVRRVNEIPCLAHHGKNIDSSLLLLDLSQFLKL